MDEHQLLALANDKNFIKTLKNIDDVNQLAEYMTTQNVSITRDEAEKLFEALHYFTFKDHENLSEVKNDKASVGDSDLDISGGVSIDRNPYIEVLKLLF